jgi:peptide/nickel transport system substrate-binding protein
MAVTRRGVALWSVRVSVGVCAAAVVAGLAAAAMAAQDAPARGGTAVVAITADPGHLNPAITTAGPTHTAAEILYNGLLGLDERGEPVPELAESWRVEQAGAIYRFRLRAGVVWHDGAPFTSADVKFTFDDLLLKYHARTKASMAPALSAVEAPDPRTVVFRFKQPYAPLLRQLDVTEAPILPRHVYQGADPLTHPANARPVGTGPFRFVAYTKGAEIRLARNSAYFKAGLPHLDGLVMRIIPDSSTQVLALESGEVDFLWDVPGPHRARLQANPRLKSATTAYNPGGANCIMTVAFNLERPALKDVRLRRAVGHALDRQAFLSQILFGAGKVASAPISSGIRWAHAADLPLPRFDRAESERLLESIGWQRQGNGLRAARGAAGAAEGARLDLELLHFPAFGKYGELLRQQLGAVGIGVTQRPLEPAVFAPSVFKERRFDAALISYCHGPDPEVGFRRMFDSSQIGPTPFTNAAAYRNPAVDALFNRTARTVDREERARHYRQIQEAAVADLPYLWLVETMATRVWSAACDGFKPWTGLFAEAAACRR